MVAGLSCAASKFRAAAASFLGDAVSASPQAKLSSFLAHGQVPSWLGNSRESLLNEESVSHAN
jgi:hypothetical protein